MSYLDVVIQELEAEGKSALDAAMPRNAPEEFYAIEPDDKDFEEFCRMRVVARAMGKFANESAGADDWHQAEAYYAAAHALSGLANALEQREINRRVRKRTKGTP